MKTHILLLTILTTLLTAGSVVQAQQNTYYDFLEVIVVQKANNRGKIKRIRVEAQPSLEGKIITAKGIENLKGTSQLLNYMNQNNWEFVDRKAIVSGENDPVWMSYIFRKQRPIKKPLQQ
ncbi:hypothetical protein OAC52_01715 [Flavobacteriaceae bacterium]|jgi:hypothetical protein|nr:hypothetical protein [Flavobacteriaceae bacterium]MDA9308990.1 hypothetical protein [Flavobacteriaceae bacterium]MDB3934874.1 hypothetical protein [Flavobacteriaceae bacterium]MDB9859000.1 hypothetical protein [Flavobacteriaceae bacterium]MDC1362813.1 hypothetical protein [Flavobacteriaceae bacterium]